MFYFMLVTQVKVTARNRLI